MMTQSMFTILKKKKNHSASLIKHIVLWPVASSEGLSARAVRQMKEDYKAGKCCSAFILWDYYGVVYHYLPSVYCFGGGVSG